MKKTKQLIPVLFSLFFAISFTACKSEEPVEEKVTQTDEKQEEEPVLKEEVSEIPLENRAITWEGTIKGTIPVFMQYTIQDSILSGEITYLNTKAKKPIRILGEILPNNFYHILEFSKDGFITGIMSLQLKNETFDGTWFASGNNYKMKATKSDSIVRKQDLSATPEKMYGQYAYSYTREDGNVGEFNLIKKNNKEALFDILAVHSAPGYNIASIEECTVKFDGKKDEFDFLIPEEETCNFKVKFYKDFAQIRYTNGYCSMGYFGHNATVEGLFLKVK